MCAADAYEELAPEIQATGMVRCPARLGATIARDRCLEFQRETGCGKTCRVGRVVVVVAVENDAAELEDEQRTAGAARERRGENRTWSLVCAYCSSTFEVQRGYHRKPRYCSDLCRHEVNRARKRTALARQERERA